jgi:hypothetical protein
MLFNPIFMHVNGLWTMVYLALEHSCDKHHFVLYGLHGPNVQSFHE